MLVSRFSHPIADDSAGTQRQRQIPSLSVSQSQSLSTDGWILDGRSISTIAKPTDHTDRHKYHPTHRMHRTHRAEIPQIAQIDSDSIARRLGGRTTSWRRALDRLETEEQAGCLLHKSSQSIFVEQASSLLMRSLRWSCSSLYRCGSIRRADRVVFPGVGAIRDCMSEIRRLKCD